MFKNVLMMLFLCLLGGAVYGGGYESPGYGPYDYRYEDRYRRDYSPPPAYAPGYYYGERRYDYRPERRYLPPPPPPGYAPPPPPHYRGDYQRHVPPRYDQRRDPRRYDLRGGAIPRGGWERGDRRYPQEPYRERRRW